VRVDGFSVCQARKRAGRPGIAQQGAKGWFKAWSAANSNVTTKRNEMAATQCLECNLECNLERNLEGERVFGVRAGALSVLFRARIPSLNGEPFFNSRK
jgi:hypothetical protein